jgi:hypothetical protein
VLGLFAVSVHVAYPADECQRLQLMKEVGQRLSGHVPAGTASLWVYPAGYFGFDAAAVWEDEGEAWPGFDSRTVRKELPIVLRSYPPGARIAFGADNKGGRVQNVWICWLDSDEALNVRVSIRSECDLPERKTMIGPVTAAFFVCGEFTGSHTEQNGPYCGCQYLSDPAGQLGDCQLLVDLAHNRVKGTVNGNPGPRQVHQLQMNRFAPHGTAVLTHHHPGRLSAGRPRNDSQSNWVIFRGGQWLDEDQVHMIS